MRFLIAFVNPGLPLVTPTNRLDLYANEKPIAGYFRFRASKDYQMVAPCLPTFAILPKVIHLLVIKNLTHYISVSSFWTRQ